MTKPLEQRYPNLAAWVQDGWIEIGRSDWSASLVRVLDEGGLVWEGGSKDDTLGDLLAEADRAAAAWFDENG